MAIKKSAKKAAKKSVKKALQPSPKKVAKKSAKKASKKSTRSVAGSISASSRSLESVHSSLFDSDESTRYSETSYSSGQDEGSYISTTSQDEKSPKRNLLIIIVIAVVLILGFFLFKGQCGKASKPTDAKIESTVKPSQEKAEQSVDQTKQEDAVKTEVKGEQQAGEPTTYTVVADDVLSRIATKTGASAAEIQALNPDVVWNKIRPGQEIKIPAKK